MGQADFLATYGLSLTRDHQVVVAGRSYDAKAVLAVAHRLATGSPVSDGEFLGGRGGALTMLRDLGFDVTPVDESDDDDSVATTAALVGTEHARATWALAARDVLLETARSYHAVITTKELADFVQERTKISTLQAKHYWIGDVLGRVSRDCAERAEPNLSSLCVDASGSVGSGYAEAVLAITGTPLTDPDREAATERLNCYRTFGARIPADGGYPAYTPQLATRRGRAQLAAVANMERPLCPIHHMEYPAGGVCEECE